MVFAVIPAAVIGLVATLVLAGSDRTRRTTRRYRPGRPFDFQPIWFLASPEQVSGGPAALNGGHGHPAVEGPVLEDSTGARVLPGSTGGASDSW